MSANAHSFPLTSCDRELLSELLHSLSQPLTTLLCSLEPSVEERAEQQQEAISAALKQAETVTQLIQLMREYLDVNPFATYSTTPLAPTLRSVCDDLASIAAVRDVRLCLAGSCSAQLRVKAPALRRALEYLLLMMIACQAPRSEITLLLREGRGGAELRTQGNCGFSHTGTSTGNWSPKCDLMQETMRRAQLAIAVRILEVGGAKLVVDDGIPGFALEIPSKVALYSDTPRRAAKIWQAASTRLISQASAGKQEF